MVSRSRPGGQGVGSKKSFERRNSRERTVYIQFQHHLWLRNRGEACGSSQPSGSTTQQWASCSFHSHSLCGPLLYVAVVQQNFASAARCAGSCVVNDMVPQTLPLIRAATQLCYARTARIRVQKPRNVRLRIRDLPAVHLL